MEQRQCTQFQLEKTPGGGGSLHNLLRSFPKASHYSRGKLSAGQGWLWV